MTSNWKFRCCIVFLAALARPTQTDKTSYLCGFCSVHCCHGAPSYTVTYRLTFRRVPQKKRLYNRSKHPPKCLTRT